MALDVGVSVEEAERRVRGGSRDSAGAVVRCFRSEDLVTAESADEYSDK